MILGIESSCDEIGVGIVFEGTKVVANALFSSAPLQSGYGGVFPEMAARDLAPKFSLVVQQALDESGLSFDQIDKIAIANGPGLIGSLLIGVRGAQGLSLSLKKELIEVNHIEAHLYAAMMDAPPVFPSLGLVISGGHTILFYMESISSFIPIGQTVDDAIGEAFDKVGILLGFSYPGGASMEKCALEGNPDAFPFPVGRVKGRPLDFSYSGLKTAVHYALEKGSVADLAASFQKAATEALIEKLLYAKKQFPGCSTLYVGGGVSSNLFIQKRLKALFSEVHFPPPSLTKDNGAMIAALAYHRPSAKSCLAINPFPCFSYEKSGRLPVLK